MKSMILEPTEKNLLVTLKEDKFKRVQEILDFLLFLNSIKSNYSIALDGKWGSGKTFFVMQAKLILTVCNDGAQLDPNTKQIVKEMLSEKEFNKNEILMPQVVIYYDAWSNDNDIDPILSILYCIEQSTNRTFNEQYSVDKVKLFSAVCEFITGRNISNFFESVKSISSFDELKNEKKLQECVDKYITDILSRNGKRMVIFIDELDRCKPSYAISLLERTKHYFKNENLTIVFTTNLEQLQHTIQCYYGENFEASGYLERFFDSTISLPAVDKNVYYDLLNIGNDSALGLVCKVVIKKYNFEFREILKFYTMVNITIGEEFENKSDYFFTPTGRTFDFCKIYIAPILIGLKLKDGSKYRDFTDGNNAEPLYEVLGDQKYFFGHFNELLNINETFDSLPSNNNVHVELRDKLEAVYNALFKYDYNFDESIVHIGKMIFNVDTCKNLMKVTSALFDGANYNV